MMQQLDIHRHSGASWAAAKRMCCELLPCSWRRALDSSRSRLWAFWRYLHCVHAPAPPAAEWKHAANCAAGEMLIKHAAGRGRKNKSTLAAAKLSTATLNVTHACSARFAHLKSEMKIRAPLCRFLTRIVLNALALLLSGEAITSLLFSCQSASTHYA